MKKLFSLLTVLFCAAMLSTAAFAASALPDPYELYTKAAKKAATVTSMDATGNISLTITMGETKLLPSKSIENFKILKTKDNRIQLEAVTTDADTKEVENREWYKDGYYYTNDGKTKIKEKSTVDNVFGYFGGIKWFDATKSDFKDATIEKTKDGFYRISYKMPGKKALNDNLGSEFKIGTASLSITVDGDGNMKANSSSITMSVTADDGTLMKIKSNLSYKIKSINKVAKINFPSDLGKYKLSK